MLFECVVAPGSVPGCLERLQGRREREREATGESGEQEEVSDMDAAGPELVDIHAKEGGGEAERDEHEGDQCEPVRVSGWVFRRR